MTYQSFGVREKYTVRYAVLGVQWEFEDCSRTHYLFMMVVLQPALRIAIAVLVPAVTVWSVNAMIAAGKAEWLPCAALLAVAYLMVPNTPTTRECRCAHEQLGRSETGPRQ